MSASPPPSHAIAGGQQPLRPWHRHDPNPPDADQRQADVRVIDMKEAPLLREVAVVDGRGQLLYEARTPDQEAEYHAADLVRPLPELLADLRQLLEGHPVVVHNSRHQSGVLEASYAACGQTPPTLAWQCTLELALQLHPACPSHDLGPVCEALAVGDEPFQPDASHQAAYNARFTYLLYRHLHREQQGRRLRTAPNPFHSARVDTPFQHFADDRKLHQVPFERLSSLLRSVAADANRQSQSAVLLGEPGTGKTHLMMRLAHEVLRNNRLLFVRQPTQVSHVFFHIYSRTLESLVERVGEGNNRQLDLLLIRSLRPILQEAGSTTANDDVIMAALEAEDLTRLGQDGTVKQRQRWERLEVRLLRWWSDRYTTAGFGRQVLQGLLRFCRYSRLDLRESLRRWLATGDYDPVAQELDGLSPWNEEQLREEFSLQALRVMGLLSSLDAPLILVFDQLEGLWHESNRALLQRFWEAVKELLTHMPHTLVLVALFPDRWQQFQSDFDGSISDRIGQHLIQLGSPQSEQIEEILDLRLQPLGVRAVELFSGDELERILRMPSLRSCLNRAASLFEHRVRGSAFPAIPPPPPPPLIGSADGAVQQGQRLLQLEQQLGQILERLSRLEASGASGEAPLAGNGEPSRAAEAPQSAATPRAEGWGEIPAAGPGGFYEELFLRYQESTREAIRQRCQQTAIIDESDDAGKLRQICLGYQQINQLEIESLRLGSRRVPDNVLIKMRDHQVCVAFLHVSHASSLQARLTNLNQLVLRHRLVQFILMRDVTAPPIHSKGASEARQAFLNGCGDGRQRTDEQPLDSERRIDMEFAYQLVSDLFNRELDIPLPEALALLARCEPGNWVVKMLHPKWRP
jgi:Cdc6-like AAA superfamily ATPase